MSAVPGTADPAMAQDIMVDLGRHPEADVVVNLAGIHVDVCLATYDTSRGRIVLSIHPDDLADVFRMMRRRTQTRPVTDRPEEEGTMKTMLADASTIHGWQKARKSDMSGPNCVEVAPYDSGVAVRTSKAPTGPALLFDADEWEAFLSGAKAGEFDHLAG